MKRNKWWKIFKIIWFSLVVVFFYWNWTTFQSYNIPKGTFLNSNSISVTEMDDQYIFQTATTQKKLEVIFFQGGLVDPKAYAPLCRKLAEYGYTCHLIKMAWRLPQNDYKKVLTLFDLQDINYVIGGHSQGGKMAAQFVYENPNGLQGLFMLGTSHPRDIDLSRLTIPCIKLYAENDGLASVEEVMANKSKLPAATQWVLIKGGNHSQFGYLRRLFMDNSASISLEEQQKQTFQNLIIFLNRINSKI